MLLDGDKGTSYGQTEKVIPIIQDSHFLESYNQVKLREN